MRAARLHAHGSALVVDDIDEPVPGEGEVLVEMLYAGVNPVDRYVAAGTVAADGPLPRTLGGEGAGMLDGRMVAVTGHGLGAARDGTYAERIAVPRGAVIEAPPLLDAREVAAVGVAGITAWSVVVELAEVGLGDTVLVLGAGGGVGLPIVSLARGLGARVIGQVGSPGKAEAVREAGASDVLVGDAAALADGPQVTVVLDPLGGAFAPAALGRLRPGGRHVVFGTSAGADVTLDWQQLYRNNVRVLGYGGMQVTPEDRRRLAGLVLEALADRRMRIPVGRTVPLEQAQSAFDAIGDRKVTGKVVLDLTS